MEEGAVVEEVLKGRWKMGMWGEKRRGEYGGVREIGGREGGEKGVKGR